jgi:hypothetical protein
MLRRLSFAQQGLVQVRERSGVLLALALALAGLVLTARPVLAPCHAGRDRVDDVQLDKDASA